MTRLPAALLLLMASVATASTADQLQQELYLLPVYTGNTSVAGMFGTMWRSELVVHNATDRFVMFGPCNVPLPMPCPPLALGVEPGGTAINPRISFVDAGAHGRLLYVRRDDAAGVEVKLRFADVSRRSLDAGTEMPVVRSSALWSQTLRLHNVPVASEHRVVLRVFDVDDTGPASSVEVRITSPAGDLLHREVRQFVASGHPHPAGLPVAASSIEMPLPELATGAQAVRVEIVPLTQGLRFWAYVSVTNNATNHVLLVTPP